MLLLIWPVFWPLHKGLMGLKVMLKALGALRLTCAVSLQPLASLTVRA